MRFDLCNLNRAAELKYLSANLMMRCAFVVAIRVWSEGWRSSAEVREPTQPWTSIRRSLVVADILVHGQKSKTKINQTTKTFQVHLFSDSTEIPY